MGIAAVSFKDKNGIEIVIYPQGEWDTIDFNVDTEEEGTVDLLYYLTNFNGKNIRLSISEKSEEEVKVSQDTEEEESTEE